MTVRYEDAASEAAEAASAPAAEQPADPFSGFREKSQQISAEYAGESEPEEGQDEPTPESPPDSGADADGDADADGVTDADVLAALRQPAPPTDQSALAALQETVNQLVAYIQGGAAPFPQQAPAAPVAPLTAEEYDKIFDADTGPAVLQDYISRQIQTGLQQQLQQQLYQQVMPTIDRQFVYRDFFAKNSDIDPESESTLVAAEMISARHPHASETEKLRLMGELLRQTRAQAKAIKKTHGARISRTAAPARTGTRDSRPRAPLTSEEQAMLDVKERMNRIFMGDR